ncbi:hypothetical protein MINS_40620 [Mycolicibacterium insubricum]|uniref:non-specific serine/threonine protein kinase n=1 Tax=Mycolicibacterium insubricum TaxID=444597 RepID=A0A1X0DCH3_9MYCO|nr:serine/threonine-protein kinase PknD [Mycolicibacterium insubricum]ORA70093.1 hypothetical protein BST26_11725 [Mycolicibacterium insubricum]BBZ68633.1 hypothetical protein MINS_40620 [Mycolicibacterium insubricum]
MKEVAFGRYRLLSVIGQGGMGTVYRAHDTVIDRDIAIKVLSAELAGEPGYADRFRREARVAARLAEPHIIPIYDTGEIDGQLYLTMPVVDGTDVAELLDRRGPMSPERAVHIVDQLASALDTAHAAGLVHRDVKPSNILVTGNDFAYLIDFGIAHDTGATGKLTRTGFVVGTWAYMAPERFTGGAAGPGIDVYALTCVLYECLTGSQPYPGDSLEQQFNGHYALAPPEPSPLNPTVPQGFSSVIARGMAKDPARRYRSARELVTAARNATHDAVPRRPGTPTPAGSTVPAPQPDTVAAARRRRRWPVLAGTAALLAAAAGAGLLIRAQPQPRAPAVSGQTGAAQAPTGPQPPATARQTDATVLPITGLAQPDGLAVDRAGTLYVADRGNNRVLQLRRSDSGATQLPVSGLSGPAGVALGADGAVYVSNIGNNLLLKFDPGATSTVQLPVTTLQQPRAVAADTADDIYLLDDSDHIQKLAAGSTETTTVGRGGLKNPSGIAVDAAGDVFVADTGNNRVLEVAAHSGTETPLAFGALAGPTCVAVDGAGTVYVADTGNNRVLKLPAGATAPTTLSATGLAGPTGIAVDTAGDVYVADAGNNRVLRLR